MIESIMPWTSIIFALGLTVLNINYSDGASNVYYAVYTLTIFILIITKYINDTKKDSYLRKTEMICIVSMGLIIILYMCTILKYGYIESSLITRLQAFIAYSLTSIIAGISIIKNNKFNEFYMNTKRINIYMQIIFIIIALPKIIIQRVNPSEILQASNNQSVGYMCTLFITLNLYYLVLDNEKIVGKKYIRNKILYFILNIINILILLYTGARGAFIASIVSCICIIIIYIISQHIKIIDILIYILILFVSAILIYIMMNLDIIQNGLNRIFSFIDIDTLSINMQGTSGRDILYDRTLDAIKDSPILGEGMGAYLYELGFYPHNIILQVLYETGIIGFAIFSMINVNLLYRLLKKVRYDNRYTIVLIIFLNTFINLLFSGEYTIHGEFWFVLGVISMLKENRKQKYNRDNRS